MISGQSNKYLSLDVLYMIASILLIVIIMQNNNKFDMMYLVLITFYYLRVKVYRRQNNKK